MSLSRATRPPPRASRGRSQTAAALTVSATPAVALVSHLGITLVRFTVTARSSTGAIVFEHASLLHALSQAMGLSASGMAEVRIADGSGSAHTPADLYRSMFGGHDDGAVSSEANAIGDVALAA